MKTLNKYSYLIIFLLALFPIYLAISSKGSEGGEDSIMHYLFARYAFQHPLNLLDHWGKPFYTLLASPFAQVSYLAARFFNVILSVGSAILVFEILKKYQIKNALLGFVFCLFAPVFFLASFSALTEPLFGFLLVFGWYLLINNRFFWAAFSWSFLLFTRSEAMIIFPSLILAFPIFRASKFIPFLFSAFIIYSTIGYFVFGDFWWYFSRNPYTGAIDVYGKGNWYHYLAHYKQIFSTPFAFFTLAGCLLAPYYLIKNWTKKEKLNWANFFIIPSILIAFFLVHSWMWYKGFGGSLGLIRVMTAIIPMAAIIATIAYEKIINNIPFPIITHLILPIIISIYVIKTPFVQNQLPIPQGWEEKEIERLAEFVNNNNLINDSNRVFYAAPTVALYLNIDPFDINKKGTLDDVRSNREHLKSGDLIVWDAHFGPNESRIPLDSLMQDSSLKLIKKITPENAFKTLNEFDYELNLFVKK